MSISSCNFSVIYFRLVFQSFLALAERRLMSEAIEVPFILMCIIHLKDIFNLDFLCIVFDVRLAFFFVHSCVRFSIQFFYISLLAQTELAFITFLHTPMADDYSRG